MSCFWHSHLRSCAASVIGRSSGGRRASAGRFFGGSFGTVLCHLTALQVAVVFGLIAIGLDANNCNILAPVFLISAFTLLIFGDVFPSILPEVLAKVSKKCSVESKPVDEGRPRESFDLTQQDFRKPFLIGFHGGCPDGCGSAYMMKETLLNINPSASVTVVPIGHQQQKFSAVVEADMNVFSLDITPSLEDGEALSKAHSVVIIDHHASEADVQKQLQECPNVVNLSDNSGPHCASSLVHSMVKTHHSFDKDVVDMLHKMDVFTYDLPAHLEDNFRAFKAYLTQKGERNVTVDLVEDMFKDKEKCIAKGKVLAESVFKRTNSLADQMRIVAQTKGWRVIFVKQSLSCRPVDMMHYQKRIDEHIDGKPTLILTQDEQPLSSGLFNLGLRRAGDKVNVSEVAAKFKAHSEIASGGGHPFAGGVQSHHMLSFVKVTELAKEAMNKLFPCENGDAVFRPLVEIMPEAPEKPTARQGKGRQGGA